MPLDPQTLCLTGKDAMRPKSWATQTFCDWLAAILNDTSGPYADELGVTEERQTIVTDNLEIGSAMFKQKQSPPVVLVMKGESEQMMCGEVAITLQLDMGVRDRLTDDDIQGNENVIVEAQSNEMLTDFVAHAINSNYKQLCAIGLHNPMLTTDAERQRAGQERNPHTLNFFVCVQQ